MTTWRNRIIGHGEEVPAQLLARREYMREYMRQRRASRPDLLTAEKERAAEKRKADPDKSREASKLWRERHPDQAQEAAIQYRESHREEYRERGRQYYQQNLEAMRQRQRDYRKDHPEAKRRASRKRKAQRAQTPYTLTREQVDALMARGCLACGTMEQLTLAHDVPVCQGGGTTPDNTFCLCRSCNSRMHTKRLADFLAKGAT